MEEKKLKLTDVVSARELQDLQDTFANAAGVAALTVDLEHDVTRGSNFTDFCMKHTRGSSEGCKRCNRCDLDGGAEAKATGNPAIYKCHAGLVDFAVPIIINGEHLGSIIGGQVLTEKPDEQKFRKIAREINVNPDEYIAALRKVPIIPDSRLRAAVKLMGIVAKKIGDDYTSKAKLNYICDDTNENVTKVVTNLENFQELAENIENVNNHLVEEIATIIKSIKDINGIVKSVGNIADETQMISFNASIESARAGEHGKSFAIIANDIRRLAMESKKVVSNVQVYTNNIQKSLDSTSEYSKKNIESLKNERNMLAEVKDEVSHILDVITTSLKEL